LQNKPVILLGAGGHAKMLLSLLKAQQADIIAVIAPLRPADSSLFNDLILLQHDNDIVKYATKDVVLVNGIGGLPKQTTRRRVYEHFRQLGYQFRSVIATNAIVAAECRLAQGVQILPGAIVNTDAELGENVLINSGAIIEHDCLLQAHTVISPGAVLCGGVHCGVNAYVGAAATVIQGIRLGENSIAGAGSTVVQNLLDNQVIYCAKAFIKG
jgi:sugar O-acyltransferase (sialic acid O-acetyltransferase NeuD family)